MATYRIGTTIPLFFLRIKGGALVEGLSVTVKVINVSTGTFLLGETPLIEVSPGVYTYLWTPQVNQFLQCAEIYTVNGREFANQFTIDLPSSAINVVQIEADVFAPEVEADAFTEPNASAVVYSVTSTQTGAEQELINVQGQASESVQADAIVQPDIDETIGIEC